MGAQTENMGLSRPSKERRSGKDRRKHIDPRYRNPAYAEFVDRRVGERRGPVYDEVPPFVKEHPIRKWIVLVAILAVGFLAFIFFCTNFIVCNKCPDERRHTGTITLGYDRKETSLFGKGLFPSVPQKGLDNAVRVG